MLADVLLHVLLPLLVNVRHRSFRQLLQDLHVVRTHAFLLQSLLHKLGMLKAGAECPSALLTLVEAGFLSQ